MSDSATFDYLASGLAANLATDEPAKSYLCNAGITSAQVWQQYRLGSVPSTPPESDREKFSAAGLLAGNGKSVDGIVIPTFDPGAPDKPVGFVRCWNPHSRHRFITDPAGLIVPRNITEQPRVVIADVPMLCLRLAQMGVQGVVCAEMHEVLPLYREWLADRKLIVVASRTPWVEALKKAVADLGLAAEGVQVHADLPRSNPEALASLGLDKQSLNPSVDVTITPLLVRDLVEFARARIAEGIGADVLKSANADVPEFVEAYGIGYLPSRFREALDANSRAALYKRRIENAIIVPAYDASGAAVDLLAFHHDGNGGSTHVCLCAHPAGLIAPKIASAFDEIIVVDSFRLAASLFKSGKKNVMLFRGIEDLTANLERLWKSGVRHADVMFRRDAADAVAKLEVAWIVAENCGIPRSFDGREKKCPPSTKLEPKRLLLQTEPSAVPEAESESDNVAPAAALSSSEPPNVSAVKLDLVKHDTRLQQATFKAGKATYISEIPFDSSAKLAVEIRYGDKFHRDRFDLTSEAQRKRFSTSGALRTGVPFESIAEHLLHLLDAVRVLQQEILNPTTPKAQPVMLTDAERKEATAYLKRPDLLNALVQDMERVGWTGEERLKRHLLLLVVSRLLDKPASAALRAPPSSGKSFAIETVSQTLPPEEVVHVSSLSGSALHYNADLRHKLLVIDEADALTPEVVVALRVLQSRGALSHSSTTRDALSGKTVAQFSESQGPVAVLTSTTSELDTEFLSRCFDLSVDTSQAQTERILAAQRRAVGNALSFGDGVKKGVLSLHRNIHRLLRTGVNRVSVPFFERIEFPGTSVRHRREQEKFLGLLQASALLHQHQRARQWIDGVEYIVAVEQDFEIALALVTESAALSPETLTQSARVLLAEIRAAGIATFTMENLRKLRPEWDRQRFRTGLGELLELGYIVSPVGGRGKLREYKATAATLASADQPGRIRLRTEEEMAELVKLVRDGFSEKTNFSPKTATG